MWRFFDLYDINRLDRLCSYQLKFPSRSLCDVFLTLFQTVEHGFPHKPSAVAYDKEIGLLAIGTSTGFLKMYPLAILIYCHFENIPACCKSCVYIV